MLDTKTQPSKSERAGAREMLLQQGRELAERVIFQYERWCRAPFNSEEAARLNGLRKQFVDWERKAQAQCPGLDTLAEFSDSRLRPYERPVTTGDLARLRRMPSWIEAHALSVGLARQAEQRNERHEDSGFWSGMPGGI